MKQDSTGGRLSWFSGLRRVRLVPALALAAIAFVALIGLLPALVSAALVSDSGTCDVTIASNTTSADCTLTSGAKVSYIGSSDTARQASGTGLFDPFVRLQGSPTEQGFNTDAAVTFDTKTGTWTHAIKVNAIPLVDCDGPGGSSATCWELFNDINDTNSARRISLNDVQIFFTNSAVLSGYTSGPPPAFSSPAGNVTTEEYSFHGDILINDVNSGSGRGDLRYLVPTEGHDWDASTYFVLYSKWGTTASSVTAANGTGGWSSDGGFEEWKVRKTPNVSIVKTEDAASVSAGSNIGFTITVTNSGVADATGVTISDPLPAGSGVDWAENPDNPNCSISGTPPTETLNCGPVTLAAGGGSLSVHVQSATTSASCGTYNNTATFTSTNAGTGSDSASVIVNCPDVRVEKTPDGLTIDAGEDAVFTIVVTNVGPGSASNVTLSDNLPDSGLDWTLGGADAASCSITGAVGSEVLTCNFGTLAQGATRTITATSPTDQEDCRKIENTVTISATGDINPANNSNTGDITPQCSAIIILKQSTKGGNPLVANPGAVFSYDSSSVTDNGTGDEDAAVGSVCVGGLTPGTYTVNETTPPTGYGGASQTNLSAVAAQGTNCTTNLPTGTGIVTFTNPPLFDIQVNFRDGGSGETSLNGAIVCTNVSTGTPSTTDATGWDDTLTVEDVEVPAAGTITIQCTLVVDP